MTKFHHTVSLEDLAGEFEVLLASDSLTQKKLVARITITPDGWSISYAVKHGQQTHDGRLSGLAGCIRVYNEISQEPS